MTFSVAIVGRPNVGKSTLFNRLVGRRLALVDDLPGVTRDRREGRARLGDLAFTAIDTAGLEESAPGSLSGRMQAQTEAAIAAADAILFLIDAPHRPDADRQGLRRSGAPLRQARHPGGEQERRARRRRPASARPMRSGSAIRWRSPPSTAKGFPISTMRCARRCLRKPSIRRSPGAAEGGATSRSPILRRRPPSVSRVIGRPNTGKSTLINRLLGEDRLLTGPEAGITRDSIAVDVDMARPHIPHPRHRGHAAAFAHRGEAREAFGRRRDQCDPLRRSGDRADGRAGSRSRSRTCASPIWSSARAARS